MDIKDFILIGGGLLIVAVVAHGFWLAYRAKREPYRLDIVRDLVPDDVDDIERLRGELPNGGSRIRSMGGGQTAPANLELELELPQAEEPEQQAALAPQLDGGVNTPIRAEAHAGVQETYPGDQETHPVLRTDTRRAPSKARVADIQIVASNRAEPKTAIRDRAANNVANAKESRQSGDTEQVAEELLVVGVLAPKGTRFEGDALVNALRKQGLKYGEMNIFHRVDHATKVKNYSVANVVEPGTFDLSDLEALSSPGITFFMQLPGPEDASAALDDMLNTAQQVAYDLGGELRDEQMSVLTGQTREHMRQRIADFARRKLSKRA